MLTFKVLSMLINYPNAEMHAALEEMPAALEKDSLLLPSQQQPLLALIDRWHGMALMDLQERYVELFDRGRKLSLHLYEHVHGESKQRGPAMVALMEYYESSGYTMTACELPDYLPLVLEFLSLQPLEDTQAMLREAMPVLTLIGARLRQRESEYAVIFEALEAIAGSPPATAQLHRRVLEEGPDETLADVDKYWEEAAVTFTQGSALSAGSDAGARQTTRAAQRPIKWVADGARNLTAEKLKQ